MADSPTDEHLVEFARSVLGGLADRLIENDSLRETVIEARASWQELYEIARSGGG